MSQDLPRFVRPALYARSAREVEARVPVAQLSRLAEGLERVRLGGYGHRRTASQERHHG